jgi:hypothetical protein
LLTYSGHGSQIPDVSQDEVDHYDETWCLYDGQLLDDELFSLLSVGPEEAGVDLGLFVLEGDIEGHNVTVLNARGHAFVAATVIEDETFDKARLSGHLVLHVHDLNHVEVDWLVWLLDGLHGLNEDLSQGIGNGGVDLGHQGGTGNLEEELTLNFGVSDFGSLQEGKSLLLSKFNTVNKDARVNALTEVSFSLTHQLTDEEHIGGSTITNDVILSGSSTTDHSSSWVLDLLHYIGSLGGSIFKVFDTYHFVEEDITVLGDLHLTGTTNQPKLPLNLSTLTSSWYPWVRDWS